MIGVTLPFSSITARGLYALSFMVGMEGVAPVPVARGFEVGVEVFVPVGAAFAAGAGAGRVIESTAGADTEGADALGESSGVGCAVVVSAAVAGLSVFTQPVIARIAATGRKYLLEYFI